MTNVLTANQANGTEAGNTTGVVTTGAGSTVTSSTTQKFSGARSIKCVCAGSAAAEGVKTTTTAITVTPGPWTFSAMVYASVEVDVTIAFYSTTLSIADGLTRTIPATTWTRIQWTKVLAAGATDGVLHVRTGETQACDLYVDELGAWAGVGGDWRLPGVEIPNKGGVNSNQVDYYAGLAPISTDEANQIALGKNDNEVDWDPRTDQSLTLTAEEDTDDPTGFTWTLTIAPPVQVKVDFGDDTDELVTDGSVSHVYADAGEVTATATWPGYTTGSDTFTVVDNEA